MWNASNESLVRRSMAAEELTDDEIRQLPIYELERRYRIEKKHLENAENELSRSEAFLREDVARVRLARAAEEKAVAALLDAYRRQQQEE
jgi:hypothetical protein